MRVVAITSLFVVAASGSLGCAFHSTFCDAHPDHCASAGTGGTAGTTTASLAASTSGLATTSSGAVTSSAGSTTSTSSTGTGAPACSDEAKLMYVLSSTNKIYQFAPTTQQFTVFATPDCVAGGVPNSMAIDRNFVAWLNYVGGTAGQVFAFDLKTKTGCTAMLTLPAGFTQVGMGFSSDTPGGATETLYVDGIGGAGLGKIDTATKTFTKIATFGNDATLAGGSCELTGDGLGNLYGYFNTSPNVRIAQIDKSNANILSDDEIVGVGPPSDWAFGVWGGDFYLFAAPNGNTNGDSSVIHYQPSTGVVNKTYIPDVGFTVNGAAVSTCAPAGPGG
jgi:hypothetical protein